MIQPANLAEAFFHVINVNQGLDLPDLFLVIVTGKATDGTTRFWTDDYSIYNSESNLVVTYALDLMKDHKTGFWEAPDFIRDEWLNEDGSWALRGNDGVEI